MPFYQLRQTLSVPVLPIRGATRADRPSSTVVFGLARIDQTGKITVLHQFSPSDGVPNSAANLVYALDGNIYSIGNQYQYQPGPAFIYRFTPTGAYSRLLTFSSFPIKKYLPLMAASDGNLYGAFGKGGTNNTGEIYQATLSGQLQTVANFPAAIAVPPLSPSSKNILPNPRRPWHAR